MATSGVPSWSWPHEVVHVTPTTALHHHVTHRLNCPAPSCHASPDSTVGWCCHGGWGRLLSFHVRSSFRSCTVGWCCHACWERPLHRSCTVAGFCYACWGRLLTCPVRSSFRSCTVGWCCHACWGRSTPLISCQVQLQVMHCGMVLSCMLGETPLMYCQVQIEVSHAHSIIMSCQFQLQVMRANEITACA